MTKRIFTFTLVALTLLMVSCKKDEPEVKKPTLRTVLVYMAANNSLGSDDCDRDDLAEMEAAVRDGALGETGRLLIFYAPTDGSQTLYEMTAPNGELTILKTYDTDEYVVSASRMSEVMYDARKLAPAEDYGLIMWSHALGWTQDGIPESRTWGDDRHKSMNITTLANVLAGRGFSWIYFDCCYMGSVEVLYQLRGVTHRIVASASEIPLDGMPYDKNLALFFSPTVDLEQAAQNTFDYYNALSGKSRTCTVSVYDLKGMDELARKTAPIYFAAKKVKPNDFVNLPLTLDPVALFYDFGVYVEGMVKANEEDENYLEAWKEAYGKVVTFYRATPMLWNRISLEKFTGMSTFIMRTENDATYRNYNTLDWYKDVAEYLYRDPIEK